MHVSLWNVGLQTLNFVLLAWLLQRFLFAPVRAVLAKRQGAIETSMREAEAKKGEAERVIEEYRARSAGIGAEVDRARLQALAAVEKEAQGMRDEAARQAQGLMEHAKAEVLRERLEALGALEQRAAELATSIARRLLADALPDSDAPFLSRVTASIDALEPDGKATLGRQMAAGSVEMVSSRPLEPGARKRFEEWLTSHAAKPPAVAYNVDPSLIAGVELRLPSGVWRANWRASLERTRAELGAHAAAA